MAGAAVGAIELEKGHHPTALYDDRKPNTVERERDQNQKREKKEEYKTRGEKRIQNHKQKR